MISYVPVEQIDFVWPMLLPMVERGLRHGQGDSMAPCHVLHRLKSGDMMLWVYHEGEDVKAGMILQVNQFPTKKVVFVVMLAGENMQEWVDDMESALIDYKDLVNADCIEASCRDGLVKKLSQRGWKRKATILEAPEVAHA